MVNALAMGATTLQRDVIVIIKIEVEVRDVVQCPTPSLVPRLYARPLNSLTSKSGRGPGRFIT